MVEYTFTLKYQLGAASVDFDELVEQLGNFGCDDALVGLGQPGRVALEFIRDAPNAQAAIKSALADVRRALPDAILIEAAPDLVGVTDVAQITGVTRQNIRKLMLSHAETLPVPVHAGTVSLWHLSDVLTWLGEHVGYAFPKATLEVARAAERVNVSKEAMRIERRVRANEGSAAIRSEATRRASPS